jgi:NDP-hexose 4-ketoreductase
MRVLVIGAGGFIGAHVRRRAELDGMEVVTAGRSMLAGSEWHYRLDLADQPLQIAAVLAEAAPDAVVNCAGATVGGAPLLAAANVNGTYALVRAMLLANRPARLVHLGSAAEYGRGVPGVPVAEGTPPRPLNLYGATKLAGTQAVELARSAGLDAVVLRVFNAIGPGAPASLMPGRMAAALRAAMPTGDDLRLGPLDAVRDFVDVRDIARAALVAASTPGLPHPIVNIAGGRGVPVRSVVKVLLEVSGASCAVREDAPGSPRGTDVPWQEAAIGRAATDLAWHPELDLRTSVADLWKASR